MLTAATHYVAVNGDDNSGDGTAAAPWATITHALDQADSADLILVRPGTYYGRIRIRGTFNPGVVVRSEVPYLAKLRNNDRVITAYTDSRGVSGITIEGFDIAHSGPGAAALVVHIDGGGNNTVNNLSFKDNILHDSYNNDILKINNGCTNILVQGNMFYNQSGSDEHIDINSVSDITVTDNIFFNDFEGSGRINANDTSSYVVVNDSNGASDIFTGSHNITLARNIFANWQGSSGSNFILLGEDGNPFHEAYDVLIENNLLLGNAPHVMRSAFGVKGGRDIVFRHNTVVGDLPALAFAMRLNREGDNPVNTNISFYNNIWSDPTGSMGAENSERPNDFSDTPLSDTDSFTLHNNLYYNGGSIIPEDTGELVNPSDDDQGIFSDPLLPLSDSFIPPRWSESDEAFVSGDNSIREVFVQMVQRYATLDAGSSCIDTADPTFSPALDILGDVRQSGIPDRGAFEKIAQNSYHKALPATYFLLF